MIARVIHLFFTSYTVLLMIRIFSSWVPHLQRHRFIHFIAHYTEPYLKIFRKIIPPIGGMLDLSPLLGFFALRLIEGFLLNIVR